MRDLARRTLFLLALLATVSQLPTAQAAYPHTLYGDIEAWKEPEPTGEHSHGYTEYVVWLHNVSSTRPHQVGLSLPSSHLHDMGLHLREVSRTVDVGPDSVLRVPLWVPSNPHLYGRDVSISVDGKAQLEPISMGIVDTGSPYSYHPRTSQALVLVGSGVDRSFASAAASFSLVPGAPAPPGMGIPPHGKVGAAPADPEEDLDPLGPGAPSGPPAPGMPPIKGLAPAPASPTPAGGTISPVTATLPVSQWTTSWLGLSRYDGITLTAGELAAMPPAAQTALWQYTECGGSLLLFGSVKLPAGWRRQTGPNSNLQRFLAGFGTCFVSREAHHRGWNTVEWRELYLSWLATAEPWQSKTRSQLEANNAFPVVESLGIPVVGLFLLMLGFAVVIGPINIMLLARRRRRIWLYWTVPAISLATCVAVFGYMIMAEGWRGQRRTETVTILDQESHRAATIGWTAFYSPLTPTDGLHFSPDTELTLQWWQVGYYRQEGSPCTLSWSQDQHLARGWVNARVPAHFMVRKNEARRERLTLGREKDGSLTIVNGLGAPIHSLWYADEKSRIYRASDIPAGRRATLTPQGEHKLQEQGSWTSIYRKDWLGSMGQLAGNPESHLLPGTYLAELEGTPFLEEGLTRPKPRECHSMVLGLVRENGDEG